VQPEFGNLIRECGVLMSVTETMDRHNELAKLGLTILLGLSIGRSMVAGKTPLRVDFAADHGSGRCLRSCLTTAAACSFAKFLNLFRKHKETRRSASASIRLPHERPRGARRSKHDDPETLS
jgi:Na+-transporting methylmalonyl-CoA/oxaloacetate decarboxylase beta subunit